MWSAGRGVGVGVGDGLGVGVGVMVCVGDGLGVGVAGSVRRPLTWQAKMAIITMDNAANCLRAIMLERITGAAVRVNTAIYPLTIQFRRVKL